MPCNFFNVLNNVSSDYPEKVAISCGIILEDKPPKARGIILAMQAGACQIWNVEKLNLKGVNENRGLLAPKLVGAKMVSLKRGMLQIIF